MGTTLAKNRVTQGCRAWLGLSPFFVSNNKLSGNTMALNNTLHIEETCLRNITRIFLLLVLFAGCDRQVPSTVTSTSEFSGRLEAVNK